MALRNNVYTLMTLHLVVKVMHLHRIVEITCMYLWVQFQVHKVPATCTYILADLPRD